MNAKASVLFFCILLGGITLWNLLTPSRTFSENENRYLKQMPEFSASALLSGSYTADFDEYVTDQFANRDLWVGAKTLSERLLGKRSSGGVYFGSDNYLIDMFDTFNQRQFEKNLEYLRSFSLRATKEAGVQVNTILAPSAGMILTNRLPGFAPELNQQELLDQVAEAVPGFVDISDALSRHREEYIYYRTDHHWTTLGAFYGYNAWRTHNGLEERPLDSFREEVLSDSFYGTNYSKANLYTIPPDTIHAMGPRPEMALTVDYNFGEMVTDTMYETSFLEVKDKYSVFLNANQPVTTITTGAGNGRRLLLVKDSYANAFVQMLTRDYEEITVLDLRYYKNSVYEFMEENGITDVLILYNLKGFCSDTNLLFLDR